MAKLRQMGLSINDLAEIDIRDAEEFAKKKEVQAIVKKEEKR